MVAVAKRKRTSEISRTPSKRSARKPSPSIHPSVAPGTPSRRTLGAAGANGVNGLLYPRSILSPSPTKNGIRTPQKRDNSVRFAAGTALSPPPVVTNADRSARRKSVRRIVARAANGDLSDDEDEEDMLARRIYGDSSDSSEEEAAEESEVIGSAPPIKGAKRGRKKKEKEPELPPVTEGPESYFYQNRKAIQITSNSTLASLSPLDHAAYFNLIREHIPDHLEEREHLESLHKSNFSQWEFELTQGFNILLYGYGSKRKLLMEFAKRLHSSYAENVIVVNGYVPTLAVKDILSTVATALLGQGHNTRLGSSPNEMLENILSILDSDSAQELAIVIHNLDGEQLRQERSQVLLSRLSAHPKISVIASIDHIRAPLLWDAARVSQFNFLWHDATTFAPYTVESSIDDSLALIGGSARAGGTKGVKYVLASLPMNAKSLFRVLLSHQLQAMADDRGASRGGEEYGVEFRVLYQKAVEEFICSNDMAFRTLLKEFHDHQMVTSRKDAQGTEVLWAPFKKEEMETILEDIIA